MKHDDEDARREVTRRRPRTGSYCRTVINLTVEEERKLRLIAAGLGMDKAEERKPSKAMVIAELIDRAARGGLGARS